MTLEACKEPDPFVKEKQRRDAKANQLKALITDDIQKKAKNAMAQLGLNPVLNPPKIE